MKFVQISGTRLKFFDPRDYDAETNEQQVMLAHEAACEYKLELIASRDIVILFLYTYTVNNFMKLKIICYVCFLV